MPELPEVETIVRGLDPLVRGRPHRSGSGGAARGFTSVGRSTSPGCEPSPSGAPSRASVAEGKYILVDVAGEGGVGGSSSTSA